ncbi:MAG: hypothetical protein WC631_00625 [Candidatus Paceibacterota bacterium]|jgi:hypothetical protein
MFKIDLNKQLDYEVYADFWDFSVAGANFGELIKKEHPKINLKNYNKYIDDFYTAKKSDMLKKQKGIKQILEEKQKHFFGELTKLFDIDFSQNTYHGYLSIFNCNPRWPETKTFQIYWKKDLKHALEVIFHESLHFAFFEYLDKYFFDQIKGLNKNSGILWELSEIFNVIILNLPQFREIIEIEEKLFYPELQDKLIKAQNLWGTSPSVKDFVNEYLKIMTLGKS